MREIKGAVFDADGTLFDSMGRWDRAGEIYLRRKGIRPGEDTKEQLETMTKMCIRDSSVTDGNPLDQISEYTVMVTIRRRGRPCFSHGNSKKPCDMVQKLAVPGIELSVSFHQGDPSALGTVIIDK